VENKARITNFCFFFFVIFLLSFPTIVAKGIQCEWSSAITAKTYYWKATKTELRDLKTNESYHETFLIGGKNSLGQGTSVSLDSDPPSSFDFFNGSRLELFIVIGGDQAFSTSEETKFINGTDYHLCILPLKIDGESFFQALFNETSLLENLTHCIFINSAITNTTATANLKYNYILDVQYEWDITIGLLTRKTVTAPSGLQLIMIPGRGWTGPGWQFSIVLLAITVCFWVRFKRRRSTK